MYPSHTISRLSRRLFLRASLAATAAVAAGAVLAACGETAAPTPMAPAATAAPTVAASAPTAAPTIAASASTATTAPAASGTAVAALATSTPLAAAASGKIPGGSPLVPDAYTKLPPPFASSTAPPAKGGKISVFMVAYNPPPAPKAQNRYWQELEKRVGAQLDLTFVTAASYGEKIAVVTAGGDLPDLMYIDTSMAPDQYRALLQGAYTDLTPLLTGSALKEFPNLATFPQRLWDSMAISKKLYGVPRMRYFANGPLFFRQDWAEKVGIPQAKNAEELFNLMAALAKMDPDGNGRADTYGMTGISNNIFSLNWLYHMFRVPNMWRQNPDGSLTNQIETDEFRATIAYARRLWEAGAYHPDAATMSLQQARDALISSKVGGYSSGFLELPGAAGIKVKTRTSSAPNANVVALLPPGHDGGQPAWRTQSALFGFVAINSRAGRDRGRVKELLRVLDWWAAPFGSEEYTFLNFGLKDVHHTIRPDGAVQLTDAGRAEIAEIPLLANSPPVFYYPDTPEDGPYLQGVIRQMLATAADNPVETLYSVTNTQKNAELGQLQRDRLTDIIVGREPLTALDQYVKDWRSRGGDMIRKEYQDALKG